MKSCRENFIEKLDIASLCSFLVKFGPPFDHKYAVQYMASLRLMYAISSYSLLYIQTLSVIFNRPGVAGAVLQTCLSLTD